MNDIEHQTMREKIERTEIRVNNHSQRLTTLEKDSTTAIVQINYLIKEISNLVSTIKWAMTFAITVLIGFFIWYIQSIPR